MKRHSRIFVAGSDTMVGRAIVERLRADACDNLVGLVSDGPDLTIAAQVDDFFAEHRPEYVFHAAGISGGIGLNVARPAELMRDNLLSVVHVLHAAHANGVKKLVYLASSCSYPREAPQPLRVESLLAGPVEPTSAPYAIAKLAGWQLCDAYRRQEGVCFVTAIPASAFGPHDDFSPAGGHVIPALMRRMHEAREQDQSHVSIWGSGKPLREFIYVRDLADACVFVMRHYDGAAPINLGSGQVYSIAQVAREVAEVVGFTGRFEFDAAKPDGAPLKALDSTPLRALGWRAATEFNKALIETYEWHAGVGRPRRVRASMALESGR